MAPGTIWEDVKVMDRVVTEAALPTFSLQVMLNILLDKYLEGCVKCNDKLNHMFFLGINDEDFLLIQVSSKTIQQYISGTFSSLLTKFSGASSVISSSVCACLCLLNVTRSIFSSNKLCQVFVLCESILHDYSNVG